ncbi:hypothetical protein [Citrobacter sp. Marseille-Q3906]|uniref:hypothetical protein n=1 Tax=Citrobacter sp. Marseille-Q3906 TaxID=2866574 RepID=UPI001CE470E7|nr:hypothetical protein [Citrobacter sp. Marseille-Q3906]
MNNYLFKYSGAALLLWVSCLPLAAGEFMGGAYMQKGESVDIPISVTGVIKASCEIKGNVEIMNLDMGEVAIQPTFNWVSFNNSTLTITGDCVKNGPDGNGAIIRFEGEMVDGYNGTVFANELDDAYGENPAKGVGVQMKVMGTGGDISDGAIRNLAAYTLPAASGSDDSIVLTFAGKLTYLTDQSAAVPGNVRTNIYMTLIVP